jgi:hypothetical protein
MCHRSSMHLPRRWQLLDYRHAALRCLRSGSLRCQRRGGAKVGAANMPVAPTSAVHSPYSQATGLHAYSPQQRVFKLVPFLRNEGACCFRAGARFGTGGGQFGMAQPPPARGSCSP